MAQADWVEIAGDWMSTSEVPDNGWSLFGLMKAPQRQGNVQETREVQHRFFEAWKHANLVLTESRL